MKLFIGTIFFILSLQQAFATQHGWNSIEEHLIGSNNQSFILLEVETEFHGSGIAYYETYSIVYRNKDTNIEESRNIIKKQSYVSRTDPRRKEFTDIEIYDDYHLDFTQINFTSKPFDYESYNISFADNNFSLDLYFTGGSNGFSEVFEAHVLQTDLENLMDKYENENINIDHFDFIEIYNDIEYFYIKIIYQFGFSDYSRFISVKKDSNSNYYRLK